MRRLAALIALFVLAAAAPGTAATARFEGWTATCADGTEPADCRIGTEGPARAGARDLRLTVARGGAKDAVPRLTLTLVAPVEAPARPRVALAVDGGAPVRLRPGADLSTGPGADSGTVEIRLSDAATRRLLPFLRRGKTLSVEIEGDNGATAAAALPLAGLAGALAEVDARQARTDKPDALVGLVGGGSSAALTGRVRDVAREALPATLKAVMVARDCTAWDRSEPDPSFLVDESYQADLGDGRTLWAVVCASGAYNVDFALFVEDPSKAADRFEPLLFAAFVESIGWTGVDTLANVAYDPFKKLLTAFDKGRGAGDCGAVGAWEWVGAAFRMVEYRAKEECDGTGEPGKFPIVFRGER